MSRFEKIISVLTCAAVVIAGLTGGILRLQLSEMRTEQRAWMSISSGNIGYQKDAAEGITVTAPVTISNTGKTPARHYVMSVVIEKVKNGNNPRFIYENVPHVTDSAGIIPPNDPHSLQARLFEPDPTDTTGRKMKDRLISQAEYQEILDGDAYMALYAYITYDDIFGSPHWRKFCVFSAGSLEKPVFVTAKGCTDYNNVDDN